VLRVRWEGEFLEVVFTARAAFSVRSWPYFKAMVIPWLLLQGQRCVTRLHAFGSHARSLSSYYRFLSDGKLRAQILSRSLVELVVRTFGLSQLLVVVDDTLCPKWGRQIFGTGTFFDHCSRPRPGYLFGHNWVVLSLVVDLFGVPVALPFSVRLYRTEKSCLPKEFRTRHELVLESLGALREWTALPISLLGDGAYFNASLIRPLQEWKIGLVSRMRKDATLRADPPTPARHRKGRRPRYGHRLPSLAAIARSGGCWKLLRVHIYRSEVSVRAKTIDAWWPTCGQKIRLVIVRSVRGRVRVTFLASTDLTLTATEVIERFARRWSIEQLFSDVKLHLGLDSAEVRKPRSVLRHALLTFACATWIHVWHYRRDASRQSGRTQGSALQARSLRSKLCDLRAEITDQILFSKRLRSTRSRRNASPMADLFAHALTAA
jgi:hypothetical protein